jgi:predicted Fe-Mo cluster-binding NifX family protein
MGYLENVNDKELEEIKHKKLEKMFQELKKEGGEKVRARVVVPTMDESGLNAQLAEHFGRAPYFAVVELDENSEVASVKTVPNVGEHAGGSGQTHDHILGLKPNAIIVYGMGPRGLIGFQSAGVAVLQANANTVREVITAYKDDNLQELTEGCHHAHHQ